MNNEPTPSRSTRKTKQIIVFLFMAVLVMSLIVAARTFNIQELLLNALNWIESLGWLGVVAFIAIYALAAVLFVPGSILTLGAGFIFGVVFGSLYVFIAATLGATGAFLVGRYFARGWVSQKIEGNSKFQAIDKAVAKEGFKIVLLTRLSPILPFNLLNYAFGVTQVSLKDYVLGSVGMIPGTIMYVYFGSLASSLATLGTNQPSRWAVLIIGLILVVAVVVYVTRIARKALQDSV
jgi:uncharacterized membrane protein YdjX (TVP38/TMEM64 family)